MLELKFKSRFKICILFLVLSIINVNAQSKYRFSEFQVIFYTGSSHFFGDLGGSSHEGRNNTPIDINYKATGFSSGVGLGLTINNRFSARINFIEAMVRGSDAYTKNPYRNNRNLSFRSTIHEFSAMTDFRFLTFNKLGKYSNHFVAFAGIGIFSFNPQAFYKDKWYDLQPLGTEGQGIIPGKPKYSRISVDIPLGLGYNLKISDRNTLGLTVIMRKTFTDYIDDVSGNYYDNRLISEQNGQIAGILADRNLQRDSGLTYPMGTGRGNPFDNDNFAYVQLCYSRSFTYKKRKQVYCKKLKSVNSYKCPRW